MIKSKVILFNKACSNKVNPPKSIKFNNSTSSYGSAFKVSLKIDLNK